MFKKLLILSAGLLMSFGSIANIGYTRIEAVSAEGVEDTYISKIPNALTHSIYRNANIFGEGAKEVDKALTDWLYATDNLESLPFLETAPGSFGEYEERMLLDSFYILNYIQQCVFEYSGKGLQPLDSYRMDLDHFMTVKGNLNDFIGYLTDSTKKVDFAYTELQNVYLSIKEVIEVLESDYNHNEIDPVKDFVSFAKTKLSKGVENVQTIGYDATNNNFVSLRSIVDLWANATYTLPSSKDRDDAYKVFEDVLFSETVKPEELFNASYINFDTLLTEVDDILAQSISDVEKEVLLKPYYQNAIKQIYLRFINFVSILDSYSNSKTFINPFLNNSGPSFYVILDLIEAYRNHDNYAVFPALVDAESNLQLLFSVSFLPDPTGVEEGGIETDLSVNTYDLKIEKFLTNARLGYSLYGHEDGYMHLFYFDLYNKAVDDLENPEKSTAIYENMVSRINAYYEEGYKNLNLTLKTGYDKMKIIGVEDAEYLIANRNTRFTIETIPVRDFNHDNAFAGLISDNFEHPVNAERCSFDLVVTDDVLHSEIELLDEPITLVTAYYNLASRYNPEVYRYDETLNIAIKLDEGQNEKGYDYYEITQDNIAITVKDAGSLCLASANLYVEEDLNAFEEQVNNLNNQITSLNNQITALNNELTNKSATIDSLNAQISTLEASIVALQSQINELTATNESQKTTIQNLNTELNNLRTELETKKVEVDNLNKEINAKKTLNIVFIVLSAVFAASTVLFLILFLKKRKTAQ